MIAASPAATPQLSWLSSVMSTRPVFFTEARRGWRVQRLQGARVDDFGGDAFLRQYSAAASAHLDRCGDDGEVVAFALDVGLSERYLIGAIWYGAAFVHETVVAEEDRRIRAGEQDRTHQSLGVCGVDGMTTCRPGVFQYHDCGLPECCTPPPRMPNFT